MHSILGNIKCKYSKTGLLSSSNRWRSSSSSRRRRSSTSLWKHGTSGIKTKPDNCRFPSGKKFIFISNQTFPWNQPFSWLKKKPEKNRNIKSHVFATSSASFWRCSSSRRCLSWRFHGSLGWKFLEDLHSSSFLVISDSIILRHTNGSEGYLSSIGNFFRSFNGNLVTYLCISMCVLWKGKRLNLNESGVGSMLLPNHNFYGGGFFWSAVWSL